MSKCLFLAEGKPPIAAPRACLLCGLPADMAKIAGSRQWSSMGGVGCHSVKLASVRTAASVAPGRASENGRLPDSRVLCWWDWVRRGAGPCLGARRSAPPRTCEDTRPRVPKANALCANVRCVAGDQSRNALVDRSADRRSRGRPRRRDDMERASGRRALAAARSEILCFVRFGRGSPTAWAVRVEEGLALRARRSGAIRRPLHEALAVTVIGALGTGLLAVRIHISRPKPTRHSLHRSLRRQPMATKVIGLGSPRGGNSALRA